MPAESSSHFPTSKPATARLAATDATVVRLPPRRPDRRPSLRAKAGTGLQAPLACVAAQLSRKLLGLRSAPQLGSLRISPERLTMERILEALDLRL
jgi:hypothetical protein